MNTESARMRSEHVNAWRQWGPYLSERAWGTVREDYSEHGNAWDYFPHDHARSRVYRWNEDGLAGISDDRQYLCFALALWNGHDPILKERLFGLTNGEGNHGEDVKEYYYYLDNTPSHSFMRTIYKYPQAAYPYAQLVGENARRTRTDPEYELLDTGIFNENRYFDIQLEYAKASPTDLLIRITASNRGPDEATLYLLPTLWFRNTWDWGRNDYRPQLRHHSAHAHGKYSIVQAQHRVIGDYELYCEEADGLLFTSNESNLQRLYNIPNPTPYVKDAFHRYIIHGEQNAVNPHGVGTKAAALYMRALDPGEALTFRLRLRRIEDAVAQSHSSSIAPEESRGDDARMDKGLKSAPLAESSAPKFDLHPPF